MEFKKIIRYGAGLNKPAKEPHISYLAVYISDMILKSFWETSPPLAAIT